MESAREMDEQRKDKQHGRVARKYRKKPVVIEAARFVSHLNPPRGVCYCGDRRAHVHTIHDNQRVDIENGDWIIPEPDGEHFYPCKPDIFDATYEPVAD